ncbi:hypothetical protein [[Clostridium] dakarense]|uniref:hypothetical protein n=1 Tax=Faecalimicrobium dakarense TaxID=1301100 RepID=UPI0011C77EA1|nr:hypothetical protein [[Clostridium] dakarense]
MFAVKKTSTLEENNSLPINLENNIESKAIERNIRIAMAKKEMAIDLLNKNANIDFITEITGLKTNEIEEIRKEIKN